MNPLWKEMRDMVTQDMEKDEILNNFFALVFTNRCPNYTAWAAEDKGLRPSEKPKGSQVHGTDEIYLQALRELVDEIA